MSQFFFLRNVLLKRSRLFSISSWYCRHDFCDNKISLKKSESEHCDTISASTSRKERFRENTKTATYTIIIVSGVCVTAVMLWTIFRELFSSSSPNNVYSNALKLVKEDYRVQDAIGTPINGYGEESRRRRRQHVAHTIYKRNGIQYMRMQFHIQGLRNKATVHLETKENPHGKVEYRYLYVQLNYYPHSVIILEDNRSLDLPAHVDHPNISSTITSHEKLK